jgi:DNA-binding transcriptional MerR regulator
VDQQISHLAMFQRYYYLLATPKSKRIASSESVRFLTVGQTARILGISSSTLRLWESVGLVTPARSAGSYRLYTPELLDVLKRIKYLRDVKKLNVPGIKEALGSDLPVKKSKHPAKPTPDLGDKLRRLRRKRGLTVTDAARRAHISAGFLSAIELSRANPSVATIYRLAAAYGTTVLELYDLPAQSNCVIRPRNRKSLETKSGVRTELLSTGTKMLESMLIRVPPGTGSDGAYMHQGEDFLYMLEGTEWESLLLGRRRIMQMYDLPDSIALEPDVALVEVLIADLALRRSGVGM